MRRWNLYIFLIYVCNKAYAIYPSFTKAHIEVHGGSFLISQCDQAHINLKCWVDSGNLINKRYGANMVSGIGYFTDLFNLYYLQASAGINGFYLPKTPVSGTVQENLYTHLSYKYFTNNYPIYAEARTVISVPFSPFSMILRLGGGINIMRTTDFSENFLGRGVTLPNKFSGNTNINFSTSAGAAIKFFLLPLECGYRFFYLGKGYLNKNTNITARNIYANAAICTLHI